MDAVMTIQFCEMLVKFIANQETSLFINIYLKVQKENKN